MARPRLVEEGVPIGSTQGRLYGTHDDGTDDEEMITMEVEDHELDRQRALEADEARPPIDSSLMRAVGGVIHIKPKRRSNRIVIGGKSEQEYTPPTSPPMAHQHPHHYHLSSNQNHHRPAAPSYYPPSNGRRIEIGQDDIIHRMEGVEDHSLKRPLVVLDGANVAYWYNHTDNVVVTTTEANNKGRANVRGILVAVQYWTKYHIRVLVVLPQPWFYNKNNAYDMEQLACIQSLLVAAPSRDDDDAYALQIAMRENTRALERSQTTGRLEGPAYVVSNDMFRDAQERDTSGRLSDWLNTDGLLGKGRISYTFANMGRLDDHGDPELDFLPNPRHPLVIWAEQHQT